jgi:hypothetical protein
MCLEEFGKGLKLNHFSQLLTVSQQLEATFLDISLKTFPYNQVSILIKKILEDFNKLNLIDI